MPRTQVPGEQFLDHDLQRDDIDTITPGQALITKIIAGVGCNISETGVDPGTGDVTLNVDPVAVSDAIKRITATLPKRVPASGIAFMRHEGDVLHSEVPIVILANSQLRDISIAVDAIDTKDYQVIIVSNPTGSPAVVGIPLTLTAGNTQASITGLTLSMPAGDYGVVLFRSTGTGQSVFRNAVVSMLLVEV